MAESRQKQPSETISGAFDFSAPLALAGANLDSGVLFASDKTVTPVAAELAAGPSAGDDEVSLDVHPGVGARLTINKLGATAEVVKVSAVAGGGPPHVCTIAPVLGFDHVSGEDVEVEPGVSDALLVSTTATISTTSAVFRARRGVHGHTYRISAIVTLDSTDVLEHEVDLVVSDV
jgi:hypothetical protein